MCAQADSIRALKEAAGRLSTACIDAEYARVRGKTLRELWGRTADETLPDDMRRTLGRLK